MNKGLDVTIELKRDCLFVRIAGRYDHKVLMETLMGVGARAKQNLQRDVLVDVREHTGTIDDIIIHQMGEMIPALFPPGCHIAIVISKERWEEGLFLETVARNRGAMLQLFTSMEEAEQWLKASPAAGQGS